MKKGSHSKSTKRQSALGVMTRVLRLRIKDKHAKHLLEQSREVNQVWNYCQETSLKILARERRFCTGYDLDQLPERGWTCENEHGEVRVRCGLVDVQDSIAVQGR